MSERNDPDQVHRGHVPTNLQLAEQIKNVDGKIEHQADVLERIEDGLESNQTELKGRVADLEPRQQRMWYTFQALKWVIVTASGGGLLSLLL